jgi:hypothetical protein
MAKAARASYPGTFLIDGNGTIRLAHVDVDYTRRLDPDDVIHTLKELNGASVAGTTTKKGNIGKGKQYENNTALGRCRSSRHTGAPH